MFCTSFMLKKCLEFFYLLDGSTTVLLETLFQDWSRAKHWFKHFSTLILSDFFLYFFCYQFWSGYENLLLRRWLQTWNQFTEWQIFVKNKKNLSLKVSFLRIRTRICLIFFLQWRIIVPENIFCHLFFDNFKLRKYAQFLSVRVRHSLYSQNTIISFECIFGQKSNKS